MKIAAGCFGCLAFICLAVGLTLMFGGATIVTFLPSEVQSDFAGMYSTLASVSNGCCCLSAVVAIVLLAVGMSSKKEETYE